MIYVILDDFLGAEKIADLKRAMGDPSLADLNTVMMDGQRLTPSELRAAADVVPFLVDRRLVAVRRLLARFASRARQNEDGSKGTQAQAQNAFAEYFSGVPPSTDLLLIEDAGSKVSSQLLGAARKAGALVIEPPEPKSERLAEWIRRRAMLKGGGISPEAVQRLIDALGSDLRSLDQEIEKLILYRCGGEVCEQDVVRMVARTREAVVFHMVDALGMRDQKEAARVMHRLLEDGEAPIKLLTMIVRQWRMLIIAKELRQLGQPTEAIASQLHITSWQASKLLTQERKFNWGQLLKTYRGMLEIDVAVKCGQMDPALALDIFVAQASNR